MNKESKKTLDKLQELSQERHSLEYTISTVLAKIINEEEVDPKEGILTHAEGVDLMPGNIELSGIEASLVNVMVNVICFGKDAYNINGCRIPAKLVAGQFVMLNVEHILYVLESFKKTNVPMTAPEN